NYQPISYVQPIESQQVTSLAAVYGAVFNRTANGWYYATLTDPTSVWVSTGQRSTHAFPGTFDTAAARILAEMTQGARTLGPQVSTTIHNSGSATLPAPKRFDLALFLDNSPRSQQIARWFDTDEQLSWIKSRCNFQVYTPDNPTYRTRLASVVGVENFPAVVLTFADGGHIHAAAEKMIPSTSSKLADDLYYYTTLATKAREQSKSSGLTGVIKTASYNWDKSINPSMQLREADLGSDCDDGSCDRNNRPHFPSGGSEGEGLLDRARDHAGRNAVVWTGLGDEAILGLIVIVVIVAVIARRQGKI
ncbi:MAG: hypothetical protein ACTHK7_01860, partial [Aureliella sp.]